MFIGFFRYGRHCLIILISLEGQDILVKFQAGELRPTITYSLTCRIFNIFALLQHYKDTTQLCSAPLRV